MGFEVSNYVSKFQFIKPSGSEVQAELVIEQEGDDKTITIQDYESGDDLGTFYLNYEQNLALIVALQTSE